MMGNSNKLIIYNEAPKLLSDGKVLIAVLKTFQDSARDKKEGNYKIDDMAVRVVQNKDSTTFKVTKRIRGK